MSQSPISPSDRRVLEDLMVGFCYTIDDLANPRGICSILAEDAVIDLTAIGLSRLQGHGPIADFYAALAEQMEAQAHYLTNHRIDAFDGSQASATAYAIGLGRTRDGAEIDVKNIYHFDMTRSGQDWKIRRLAIVANMPYPVSLSGLGD